jgi:prophage DNA circulation protein
VKSGSTEVKMNPDIAKWIVDRYNAWQKISLDDEVVEQEDEDMKKQQEEEVFQRVQKLIQVGISALADGQKIEGKVGEDSVVLFLLLYLYVFFKLCLSCMLCFNTP